MFLPQLGGTSFTPINTTGKIMFLYISIVIYLDTQRKKKLNVHDTKKNTFDYTTKTRGRSRFSHYGLAAPTGSASHTTSDEYRALFFRTKRSAHEGNHSLSVSSLGMTGLSLRYSILIHDRCSLKQKDNVQVQRW
jgi:hypothetical protein